MFLCILNSHESGVERTDLVNFIFYRTERRFFHLFTTAVKIFHIFKYCYITVYSRDVLFHKKP